MFPQNSLAYTHVNDILASSEHEEVNLIINDRSLVILERSVCHRPLKPPKLSCLCDKKSSEPVFNFQFCVKMSTHIAQHNQHKHILSRASPPPKTFISCQEMTKRRNRQTHHACLALHWLYTCRKMFGSKLLKLHEPVEPHPPQHLFVLRAQPHTHTHTYTNSYYTRII